MTGLEDLKSGDRVHLSPRRRNESRVETITKVTKTQITLTNGYRFSRRTGREIGASEWDYALIQPLTPALEQKVKISELGREANRAMGRASQALHRDGTTDTGALLARIGELTAIVEAWHTEKGLSR